MTSPTIRERQRQVREEAILETAHEMLAERGYEAMNMDDLATQVGISKATLYQHFASKEDVAVSVIVNMLRYAEQDIRANADPTMPAIRQLEQGLRRSLERRVQLWTSHLTLPPNSVTRHPHYKTQYDHLTRILTELVETAKQQGDIDAAISTPVLVRTVLWLFKADFEDVLASKKCSAKELVNTLVQIVFNGVKPILGSVSDRNEITEENS